MAPYTIRVFGDPVLKQRGDRGRPTSTAASCAWPTTWSSTMYDAPGVGLAAPQVGVQKRLFVYDLHDGPAPATLVNPDDQRVRRRVGLRGGLPVGARPVLGDRPARSSPRSPASTSTATRSRSRPTSSRPACSSTSSTTSTACSCSSGSTTTPGKQAHADPPGTLDARRRPRRRAPPRPAADLAARSAAAGHPRARLPRHPRDGGAAAAGAASTPATTSPLVVTQRRQAAGPGRRARARAR